MFEELLVLLLATILEAPFIFTIVYARRFYRKYPSKSFIPLLVITILAMIWIFTGILWIMDTNIGEKRIELYIYIGILCMQLLAFIFSLIYVLSKESSFSANIAVIPMICSSIMLFSVFFEMITENNVGMLSFEMQNGHIAYKMNLILIIISLIEVLTIFSAIAHSLVLQSRMSIFQSRNTIQNRLALISLVFGSISIWIYNLLQIFQADWFYIIFATLLSRIFFSLGFLLLALHLIENPIFVLHMYGNTESLFDDGIIGWYFVTITEDELEVKNYHELFDKRFSITNEERLAFTSASMSMVGIQSSFHDASFVIPFPGHSDIVSLCISFAHRDNSSKDPRLKNKNLSIFAVVMPTELIQSIRVSDKYNIIIDDCRVKIENENINIEEKLCKEVANKILKAILS